MLHATETVKSELPSIPSDQKNPSDNKLLEIIHLTTINIASIWAQMIIKPKTYKMQSLNQLLKTLKIFRSPLTVHGEPVCVKWFTGRKLRHRICRISPWIRFPCKQGFESPGICSVPVPFYSAYPKNILVLVPYFSAFAPSTKALIQVSIL